MAEPMMNNNMNPFLMMMMMQGMNGDKDGGGMDFGSLAGLFGQSEASVESVWEDAVTFGTARDRNGDATIGVLETRIVPPHADDPVPRVVIKTNGLILSRPSDLLKIAKKFQSMGDDAMMLEAFEKVDTEEVRAEAQAAAQEKQNSAMIGPMLGLGKGG